MLAPCGGTRKRGGSRGKRGKLAFGSDRPRFFIRETHLFFGCAKGDFNPEHHPHPDPPLEGEGTVGALAKGVGVVHVCSDRRANLRQPQCTYMCLCLYLCAGSLQVQ